MGTEWDDLVHDLALDMAELEYRQFVIIEYNAQVDLNPYAQATPTASGDWMCEVVSEQYLGPCAVAPGRVRLGQSRVVRPATARGQLVELHRPTRRPRR